MHPKLLKAMRRASQLRKSNIAVDKSGNLTELDKGIVKGYVFIWGNKNDHGEIIMKGSTSKSISERGPDSNSKMPIKFLAYHNQSKPLSLLASLKEDDIGCYFETLPLDDVSYASDIKVGLRSGTLNNFSGGFNPVWDKSEYDEKTDTIIHKEINLFEISVVSLASDCETYAIRSMEIQEDVNDDIFSFVEKLPKQFRLEAKNLFARQKSLFIPEPFADLSETLEGEKPVKKRAIDYKFLTTKLKQK